jgi:hypothetical protein
VLPVGLGPVRPVLPRCFRWIRFPRSAVGGLRLRWAPLLRSARRLRNAGRLRCSPRVGAVRLPTRPLGPRWWFGSTGFLVLARSPTGLVFPGRGGLFGQARRLVQGLVLPRIVQVEPRGRRRRWIGSRRLSRWRAVVPTSARSTEVVGKPTRPCRLRPCAGPRVGRVGLGARVPGPKVDAPGQRTWLAGPQVLRYGGRRRVHGQSTRSLTGSRAWIATPGAGHRLRPAGHALVARARVRRPRRDSRVGWARVGPRFRGPPSGVDEPVRARVASRSWSVLRRAASAGRTRRRAIRSGCARHGLGRHRAAIGRSIPGQPIRTVAVRATSGRWPSSPW